MTLQKDFSRRDFLRLAGLSTAGLSLAACTRTSSKPAVPASTTADAEAHAEVTTHTDVALHTETEGEPEPPVEHPEEALHRLIEGNRRYVEHLASHPNQGLERRVELAAGQEPFAVVLGCSDSRVPPEIVFDRGLGDLFVVRVAGNLVDDVNLGSIEYAVEHLHSKLILVLGHERCGAVKATVEAVKNGVTEIPGHIGSLVEAIKPSYEMVKHLAGDEVNNTVVANVLWVASQLHTRSPILAEAVTAGHLKIVGGRYDLDTGSVDMIL